MAANSRLRALAAERCEAAGIRLRVPRPGPVLLRLAAGGFGVQLKDH